MDRKEALQILGLTEYADRQRIDDAYFLNLKNYASGNQSIHKITGEPIPREELDLAYQTLTPPDESWESGFDNKREKVKRFFHYHWWKVALGAVLMVLFVHSGYQVAMNVQNRNFYIAFVGEHFLQLEADFLENLIEEQDLRVDGIRRISAHVHREADAVHVADDPMFIGRGSLDVLSMEDRINAGSFQVVIADERFFERAATRGVFANLADYEDRRRNAGEREIPEELRRYAIVEAHSPQPQLYGVEITESGMFGAECIEHMVGIAAIGRNATEKQVEQAEIIIDALLRAME